LLFKDLLTWRTADKTKMHRKTKLQNAPNFIGNGSQCHVCLILVIKIKTCTYHLCKRQSSDTNVLIGRYWLSVKRPIIDWYRLLADYRCISNKNLFVHPGQGRWYTYWREVDGAEVWRSDQAVVDRFCNRSFWWFGRGGRYVSSTLALFRWSQCCCGPFSSPGYGHICAQWWWLITDCGNTYGVNVKKTWLNNCSKFCKEVLSTRDVQ